MNNNSGKRNSSKDLEPFPDQEFKNVDVIIGVSNDMDELDNAIKEIAPCIEHTKSNGGKDISF